MATLPFGNDRQCRSATGLLSYTPAIAHELPGDIDSPLPIILEIKHVGESKPLRWRVLDSDLPLNLANCCRFFLPVVGVPPTAGDMCLIARLVVLPGCMRRMPLKSWGTCRAVSGMLCSRFRARRGQAVQGGTASRPKHDRVRSLFASGGSPITRREQVLCARCRGYLGTQWITTSLHCGMSWSRS